MRAWAYDATVSNRSFVSLAVLIALAPALARAADYWVAPDGSDDATGSMDDPWATIARADDVLAPGDVLHVLAGEYGGTFDTYAAGTEDAPIVYVSEPKWGARLVGEGGPWTARGDWVDIVGFEYTGDAAVGLLGMASHTRYLENWVHDLNPACDGNGGAGIDAGNYDASDVDMIGNIVHDVWVDDTDGTPCNRVQGLYHSIHGGTVANNITWNISGFGIHTWHAPTDLVITNNLVFACGHGGVIVGAGDSPGGVIADNFLVANNIVVHNALGIVEYGATGKNNRYLNNLVFENAGGDFSLQNGLVDEGTVVGDPLFVDWQIDGSGDYHLLPGSPAIDAGIADGAPSTDIDGVARPQGAGFDIGPVEYFESDGGSSDGGDEVGSDAGSDGPAESAGDSAGDETGPSTTATTTAGNDSSVTSDTGETSSTPPQDGDGGGCACATAPTRDHAPWLVVLLPICRRRSRARHSLGGCSARGSA